MKQLTKKHYERLLSILEEALDILSKKEVTGFIKEMQEERKYPPEWAAGSGDEQNEKSFDEIRKQINKKTDKIAEMLFA